MSRVNGLFQLGRLKKNFLFWKNVLKANNSILETIHSGYKIPFVTRPPEIMLKNNKSATDNGSFVEEAISDLLKSNCIIECETKPRVVNPLTVASNTPHKKRLVLDLRHINIHVWKEHTKYENYTTLSNYLADVHYMITFDLKSGYHHIDIFEAHQEYLGFSWKFGNVENFFKFTVLAFGLSTAGHIFTNVVKCLVTKWRSEGKLVVVYLDDGIALAENKLACQKIAEQMRQDILDSGFVPNKDKCVWSPSQIIKWLGFIINLQDGILEIPGEKIMQIRNVLDGELSLRRTTARRLARIVGKIISCHLVLKNTVYIMTRHSYLNIQVASSWDSSLAKTQNCINELTFWRNIFSHKQTRKINSDAVVDRLVFSDASSTGYGGYLESDNRTVTFNGTWTIHESGQGSTWRELKAVDLIISQSQDFLKDKSVKRYTDNQAAASIISRGSNKPDLQAIAARIFSHCFKHKIYLEAEWFPRSSNTTADQISRVIDFDDWQVKTYLYNYFNKKWGPFTCDAFADTENAKHQKFYSRFWCKNTSGIDAFAF